MALYNLIARRHIGEDWSAWTNTNNKAILEHNIGIIENNGWLWSIENPMSASTFKAACLLRGIDKKRVDEYCRGRIKFVADDIEILESKRWRL